MDIAIRSLASGRVGRAAVAGVLLLAGACVDSPQEPSSTADSPLASTFDALAKDAASNGDNVRGTEFGWAAVAIAGGMTPSQLVVLNNSRREVYDAFVHATTIALPNVTDGLTTRTLIAWRKVTNVLQVVMVSAPDNVTQVLHPASMGPITGSGAPFRGAHAAYYERGENAAGGTWIGISGSVKLAEASAGAACEVAFSATSGVTCVRARFGVAFDVRLARLPAGSRTLAPTADRGLRAGEQQVNGLKLTVKCVAPQTAVKGCGTTGGRVKP
ncbi:MAG: hypothetical protein ACT4R6_12665 [Gemmatimonadaceae bacterium]